MAIPWSTIRRRRTDTAPNPARTIQAMARARENYRRIRVAAGALAAISAILLVQHLVSPGVARDSTAFELFVWLYVGMLGASALPLLLMPRLHERHPRLERALVHAYALAGVGWAVVLNLVDLASKDNLATFAMGIMVLTIAVRSTPSGYLLLVGLPTAAFAAGIAIWHPQHAAFPVFFFVGLYAAIAWAAGILVERALAERDRLQAELATRNEELKSLALRDQLTGVYNRRYLTEFLYHHVSLSKRREIPLALAMLDLDHFKRVNDELGHAAGDAVLQGFAALVVGSIRESDLFFRYGGEEFVLLLPNTPLPGAVVLCERLRLAAAAARHERVPWPVTVSIGIAAMAADEDVESLLERADGCMYHAKQRRNRVDASLDPSAPR